MRFGFVGQLRNSAFEGARAGDVAGWTERPRSAQRLRQRFRNLGINDQVLLYCLPEHKAEAAKKVKEALNGMA